MSYLIPEWAPNIHPLLVHFPIALLVTAGILNLGEILLPGDWWDERKSTVLYAVGTVSAIAVYFTGESAADHIFLETAAQPVLTEHADWALWTVWYFVIYVLIRAVGHRLQWMRRKGISLLLLAAVLPGLFLLYETGDHGAELVFGYGTGTGQLLQEQRESTQITADSLISETSGAFKEDGNGNWTWRMGPTAVGTLLSRFEWRQGEPEQLNPAAVRTGESSYALQIGLNGDEANLFVSNNEYRNIQLDAYLTLDQFEGEVEFVHHYQDTANYDFVRLTTPGTVVQGRKRAGEVTVFENGSFKPNRKVFLRVVADGTHFRAYVNRELKAHGHGDAPPAGNIGIKLDGTGNMLIERIELTQL